MASTCLAGMVGVCLIGVAIYASMNMSDGSGMVSSIKRASLAALQPIRSARLAHDAQSPSGQKEDRIQMTSAGFASRHVIHDTVVERQGSREFITIKPYIRIVAGMATSLPETKVELPPFNPFKLYSDSTPVGGGDATTDAAQAVVINVVDVPGGLLPQTDHVELEPEQVNRLVAAAAENFAYAEAPLSFGEGDGEAKLQLASYRPDEVERPRILPNTTVIQKSLEEDDDDLSDEAIAGAETKVIDIDRGDTLMGAILKAGTDKAVAATLLETLDPVFSAKDLKPGQQIHVRLVPAPSDSGQMEPVRVSVFDKSGDHIVTASRNRDGDYVASTERPAAEAKVQQASSRATLYQSFYRAALDQHIPANTILKLLRVHSYDVDFKQKVRSGDTFEVFFDGGSSEDGEELGELLYTSMTVGGEMRKFYRFRTPDDAVDYYDDQGNSAKKFLMRNPVKGGRYTSGFGDRKHPLLRRWRMHTGVDWAAPSGTPILAAGDGTIEMAERHGGYGNYIRIRHANGFATAYGHMTRFAPGSKPGASVKQGQIIGFVGSTGASTGPHCHFEVLVNSKFVNPMTIVVPRGLQLTGRELAAFQRERRRIEALMQLDPVTSRVAQVVTQ
ncbi:MAG TPA: peptidoglycan DD-metalloendopeptidase family protein [Methyloceanibacter sp.]|nr:peptidoglycan DD-metalloendopeptidase family protein [Methyloceanibacter sp.]